MFSRRKRTGRDLVEVTRHKGVPSIISADLRVNGDLVSDGDLQIEGVVEGDVKTVTVTVGEQAFIKGSVICETALIQGKVHGDIFSKNATLTRTAKVRGDIVHDRISIEAGAYLDGRCRRLEDEEAQDDIRALAGPGVVIEKPPAPAAADDPFGAKAEDDAAERERQLETIRKAAAR